MPRRAARHFVVTLRFPNLETQKPPPTTRAGGAE